jgi:16S rRNA (guanine(966)-N(2))-methyltransferase RsmD
MRITGGKYRGRSVQCPKSIIRPAMDRMRESMFAVLGDLSGLSFLDLFSGSGIVGIEAASRGAEPVYLVEKDVKKKPVLLKNISFVTTETRTCFLPAQRFLQSTKRTFDIVFLDPPFTFKNKQKLLIMLSDNHVLKDNGIALIHHPREEDLPAEAGALLKYDKRKYGGSVLSFYQLHP